MKKSNQITPCIPYINQLWAYDHYKHMSSQQSSCVIRRNIQLNHCGRFVYIFSDVRWNPNDVGQSPMTRMLVMTNHYVPPTWVLCIENAALDHVSRDVKSNIHPINIKENMVKHSYLSHHHCLTHTLQALQSRAIDSHHWKFVLCHSKPTKLPQMAYLYCSFTNVWWLPKTSYDDTWISYYKLWVDLHH